MGQTASDIRRELDKKRHELSHDVDQIEEKVRSSFDINRYVEERPLMATGVAVLAGFLLGNMVGGGGGKQHRDHRYSGYYYGGYAPQASYYSGTPYYAGTYQQPQQHQQQHQGGASHMMDTVKDSVKHSFQSTTGNRNVEETVSSVSAALTAMLMEKAKEMLDQNLPGFSEKYEQAQHQQHQQHEHHEQHRSEQDRAVGTTYSSTMKDRDSSTSYSGTSGSEHLGPSSSSSTPRT